MSARTLRRLLAWALVGLLIAVGVRVLAPPSSAPVPAASGAAALPAQPVAVLRVYDGDTLEASGVGKVRIIGIDAPDGYVERRTAEQAARYGMTTAAVRHHAAAATAFVRERAQGARVLLEAGYEARDTYGRTLAYVRTVSGGARGADLGLQMLERGLAMATRRFPHPRLDGYLQAQERARAERRGIWADARIR